MNKQETKPEFINSVFAKTMEMLTWVGLIIMAIPGIAYLIETKGLVGVSEACSDWSEPASMFWQTTGGFKASGYLLFINHFTCMDCMSIIGIMVLVLVSLVSLMVTMPKMNKQYRLITAIVVIEFIVVIMQPFLGGIIGF